MADGNTFDILRIGIASPQDIRSWSRGEVKKPETINYRTFKPERDGLFCERIFGPTKDWECHCGKYKKVKFKGIICDRCGVEVTRSKVRRRRMGHIELAAPVAHIWYVKGVPSPISLLLDMSPRMVEKVLYFATYIVTRADTGAIKRELEAVREAADLEIAEIQQQKEAAQKAAEREFHELEQQAAAGVVEEGEEPITPERLETEKRRLSEQIQQEEETAQERILEINESFKLLSELERRKPLSDSEYRGLMKLMEAYQRKQRKKGDTLFSVGLGAEAIKTLLEDLDLDREIRELRQQVDNTVGAKRARAIKRLEVVEAFAKSKNRPEWMILDVLPVMPPELRPMVQLDGGRFATSDLNDLYRRIINRNNRLRRIMEIKAPESIINHEKRLLQEAVDALIDNSRRSRPVSGSNGRALKSLSDLLKGKEGRFRRNLLGKRVDYSGRSVIVVGPHLRLDQCGLPKEMALELFKPFVMRRLVEQGFTSNIKTAKKMVDRARPEVWDALDEVIKDHPVLLNRAPTLHRLGIQAFEPVLVDGKAIQIHPLVCPPFNADFDGDQMAVHVPLSVAAQAEARLLMLSSRNLFSPADGRPVMSPEYDIVLGCYYLTQITESPDKEPETYPNEELAILAHEVGELDLHAAVRIRMNGERVLTSVGRLIFNQILPEGMDYLNEQVDKGRLRDIIRECYTRFGNQRTVQLLDDIKALGFKYGTRAGVSIGLTDMQIPERRNQIISATEKAVAQTNQAYRSGVISAGEREQRVCEHWIKASEDVAEAVLESLWRFNPLAMMANSGARGSKKQISQLAGMRGLMAEPSGRFIEDLPIKSNFHEGLSVLEYFISTHGARKGLADTALRTADAGYLTRRLVDVSQDVIVREDDCGTVAGVEVSRIEDNGELIESLAERLYGRVARNDIVDPRTKELLAAENEIIDRETARKIEDAGIETVEVRSMLTCDAPQGVCARCYGMDLSTGRLVEKGEAVGIIAAQSIGEPGTQLTLRTFHLGGVAGQYLTGVADVKKRKREALRSYHRDRADGLVSEADVESASERKKKVQEMLRVLEDSVRGLLRVVELFEARRPKGKAVISEFDGEVVDIRTTAGRQVVIEAEVSLSEDIRWKGRRLARDVKRPRSQHVLQPAGAELNDRVVEQLRQEKVQSVTLREEYLVPYRGHLEVETGDKVQAGDPLTAGPMAPQEVLQKKGVSAVQTYLVTEIQKVYKSQGVDINDKHIEVIVRQMLRKRKVRNPGDTDMLPGQVVDRFTFEKKNAQVKAEGGQEAVGDWVLLGITEAALATESFLSAASFQKTTKVLTEAATRGKEDHLVGLKENVIIGRLVPAGTGLEDHQRVRVVPPEVAETDEILPLPERKSVDYEVEEELVTVTSEVSEEVRFLEDESIDETAVAEE